MNTHVAGLTTQALLAEAQWVRGLALHLTRDPDQAADVAQETLLRAIDRPPAREGAPRAWLATVATNLVRSAGRQDGRRRLVPLTGEEPAGESGGTPEELLERMQLQRLLADLLLALDEPYREVVLLRYIEGLSSADIAQRLNVAAGTVRWRLKTGLDMLRRELDRAHGGERERWRRALIPFALLAPEGYRQAPPSAPPRAASPMLAALALPGLVVLVALIGWVVVRVARDPAREQAAQLAAEQRPRPGRLGGPAEVPPAIGVLAGRVTDGAGQVVPGAVVTAKLQDPRPGWSTRPFLIGPLPSAVADAQGRYRLAGLAPGSYGIAAHAPGRGLAVDGPIAITAGAQPITADLELERPGAVVRGRVLDESGGPVPGARVLAVGPDGPDEEVQAVALTRADDQGRYQMELGSRETPLQADAPGYAAETLPVDLEGLKEAIQDIRLLPAGRLAGTVIARDRPVEAAEVAIDLEDGFMPEPRRVTTDGAGRFMAEGLAPGRYRVTARQGSLVTRTPVLAELTGGQLRELGELSVSPGAALRGRVVGPDGAAVGDASVSLEQPRSDGVVSNRTLADIRSQGDGGFVFDGLPPGRYAVSASARGFSYREQLVDVPAAGATVEVRMRRGARIGGVVVGADGTPVAGALLQAQVRPLDQEMGLGDSRQSGADGRFTLHNLPPGHLHVAALNGQQITVAGPLKVTADREVQLTLRLAPGALVSGVARYRNGKPVVGMRVVGESRGAINPRPPGVRTDGEGRFTIGPFLAGSVTVCLVPPGVSQRAWSSFARAEQKDLELSAGEHRRGVEFVLPVNDGKLAGRLLGPDGEPQVGQVVHAGVVRDTEAWPEEHRAVTDGEGNFLLEGLPDEPLALRATHPEWPPVRLEAVRPGGKGIELKFVRGAAVTGEVRDGLGRPPRQFRVVVAPNERAGEPPKELAQELGRVRLEVSDGGGRFVLPRLPAGVVDVHVITPDGQTGRAEAISLAPGKQVRIRISLAPALTVRGVVKTEAGEPAVGWSVRTNGGRQVFSAVTDADGRFVMSGLFGDARFTVHASSSEDLFGDMVVVDRARGADQDVGILRGSGRVPGELPPGVVGMRVAKVIGGQEVVATVPGLPAARAGVLAGDRLVAIDGRNTSELGFWALTKLLRGQPGSAVRLTLERAGQPLELNLTRVPAPKD